MEDKDIRMLVQAIGDYGQRVKSLDEHGRSRHIIRYSQVLMEFLIFAISNNIAWKDMFTFNTLQNFAKHSSFKGASRTLTSLSNLLFSQGRIDHPIEVPKTKHSLPDIYEHYLRYQEHGRQICPGHLSQTRRLLGCLHDYLEKQSVSLSNLKIEHLDDFMARFKVAHTTRNLYRSIVRGFVRYLYHQKKMIKRDLAPLLGGPPLYAQSKPPKFLRPGEIQKLFAALDLSTPIDIRTYAMVHLAYSLGLRPIEISRITLGDISFRKAELTLPDRKGDNPITLPVPEHTIKAIGAYVIKARAKSPSRHLFLTMNFPYRPLSSNVVTLYISRAMKKAGLSSSSYWLRHTYAQNLLHIGRSIYEIKEMMGHDNIQSSHRYILVQTELMRKVLFDETL
ncbi:MAG: tyrosine-type recombinase/integrase [Thermodesulfobacteriota bacterium]|nr:tyrosine-type recombinase/integrase [Thermodesulfobacteriota bacterium]